MIDEKVFSGVLLDTTQAKQLDKPHNLVQVEDSLLSDYNSIKEDLEFCEKCYGVAHTFYFDSPIDTSTVTKYAIIKANCEELSVGLTFELIKSINVQASLSTFLIDDDYFLTIEKDKGYVTISLYEMDKDVVICDWILFFTQEDWDSLNKFISLLADSKVNKVNFNFKSKINTTKIMPTVRIFQENKKDIKMELYDFYMYFLSITEKNYKKPFFSDSFYEKLKLNPKIMAQLKKTLEVKNINFMIDYIMRMLVNQIIFSYFQKDMPYSKMSDYKNISKYLTFYNKKYITETYL